MKTCPNCGNQYEGYPALSRKDNKTEICADCGMREAIESAKNAKISAADNLSTAAEESSVAQKKNTLEEAVKVVKAAIEAKEKNLQAYVDAQEPDPVMLEGGTSEGYQVQMMISPAIPARIMLKYDYPTYDILEEEAPSEMWDEMAKMVGLASVDTVDI